MTQPENSRSNKKRRLVPVVAMLLVVIASLVYGYWLLIKTQQPAPSTPKVPVVSAPQKPQQVMLALPGATPIPPLKENYNDNTSLWRVVSKDYPLDNAASYVPELAPASLPSAYGHQLRPDATAAAAQMFSAAKAAGYDLIVGSGYRSYATQQKLFSDYSAHYGEAQANTFSARAGQSEHQTGLAFDVARADRRCFIDNCFGSLPESTWIANHSYEYGFIVRYPADKTNVTKYQYEPWHLRFVGVDLATALHESGLTLDEARPFLQALVTSR